MRFRRMSFLQFHGETLIPQGFPLNGHIRFIWNVCRRIGSRLTGQLPSQQKSSVWNELQCQHSTSLHELKKKRLCLFRGPIEKRKPKPETTRVRILDASKISFHSMYILTLIIGIIDAAIFYLRTDSKRYWTQRQQTFLYLVYSRRLLKPII